MAQQPASDLSVSDLHGGYAGTRILEGLSFRVPAGGRFGILGRNGVGKTTTLSCIMGLADISRGRIEFGGIDITAMPTWKRARAGIGFVPQTRDIFHSLSVEENLRSALGGGDEHRIELAFELFPRLRERRNNNGTQLSGGEQQMLAVARAMVSNPSLLLMDEPLEGLAPRIREELMEAIDNMIATAGLGCILVEQHVGVVLDFAQDVLILERGKPAFLGRASELRENPAILERSIGLREKRIDR